MTEALTLATKYAGFATIGADMLTAADNLDLVRNAVISSRDHLKNDTEAEAVLEALSLVKSYLESTRDTTRSEMNKIRGQLAGETV